MRVRCSSGTYIRTLAADIGQQLGVGAHLTSLRRTRVGACDLSHALTLEQLAALADDFPTVVQPMADALVLPEVQLSEVERDLIAHGRAIQAASQWPNEQQIKLLRDRELIAIAVYNPATNSLQPRVVF
jgi:tRNA pseudouridine55 synthase